MKTSITYDDYLRLLGLVRLGHDANQRVNDLENAAGRLLDVPNEGDEESPYYGHVSDVISGNRGVDDMLRILRITVEPPSTDR